MLLAINGVRNFVLSLLITMFLFCFFVCLFVCFFVLFFCFLLGSSRAEQKKRRGRVRRRDGRH